MSRRNSIASHGCSHVLRQFICSVLGCVFDPAALAHSSATHPQEEAEPLQRSPLQQTDRQEMERREAIENERKQAIQRADIADAVVMASRAAAAAFPLAKVRDKRGRITACRRDLEHAVHLNLDPVRPILTIYAGGSASSGRGSGCVPTGRGQQREVQAAPREDAGAQPPRWQHDPPGTKSCLRAFARPFRYSLSCAVIRPLSAAGRLLCPQLLQPALEALAAHIDQSACWLAYTIQRRTPAGSFLPWQECSEKWERQQRQQLWTLCLRSCP